MTIGITGASGHLGRLVVEHLINKVGADQVVAFSRTPQTIADLGVATRAIDFAKPQSLHGAFDGLDRLLIISTAEVGTRAQSQKNAIVAATQSGVGHVFYTSAPKADQIELEFHLVDEHRETEEALAASGLQHTVLRNNWYAQLALDNAVTAAQHGSYLSNSLDGGTAYISREEIAEATAGVLASHEKLPQVIDLTGPQALTSAEVAAAASSVSGKPVSVNEVDDATYAGILQSVGLDEGTAQFVASIGAATRRGALDFVSPDAASYLGRPVRTLEDYFRDNKAAFDA